MDTTTGQPQAMYETATLAGGCFWCLEAVYDQLSGVKEVVSGYSGGHVKSAFLPGGVRRDHRACGGHPVDFDPHQISYREILQVFFTIHDPTTLNRQGGDVGTQYRSAIFFHSAAQKEAAEEAIQAISASGLWDDPIVTEVAPYDGFYPAEEYHQEYYQRNQYQPYCQVVIAPKVAKFRKMYIEKLKKG